MNLSVGNCAQRRSGLRPLALAFFCPTSGGPPGVNDIHAIVVILMLAWYSKKLNLPNLVGSLSVLNGDDMIFPGCNAIVCRSMAGDCHSSALIPYFTVTLDGMG